MEVWQTAIQRVGYLSLPAPTASRALYLLHKIRPALILLDAEPNEIDLPALLRDVRAIPSAETTPVLLLGVPPRDHATITRDPHVVVRQIGDDGDLVAALHDILGGPRPMPRR